MDENVRKIQERLREQLSHKVEISEQSAQVPAVSFENVGNIPEGAESVVEDVIGCLSRRGWKVACVQAFGSAGADRQLPKAMESLLRSGASQTVVATPDRLIHGVAIDEAPSYDEALSLLGDDYDVVIARNYGYLPIPKIAVCKKPMEAFSMGLPRLMAFVSLQEAPAMIPQFLPEDIEGIADYIEAAIMGATPADRPVRPQEPASERPC